MTASQTPEVKDSEASKVTALQLPTDVPTLHGILKTASAQLMSHAQTVQELIKANMGLRAALHLSQENNDQLNAHIHSLVNPAPIAEHVDAHKA